MLLTEEEAAKRWCPMARTLETAPVKVSAQRAGTAECFEMEFAVAAGVNREPWDYDKQGNETVLISGRHRCIGSACMAWRQEQVDEGQQPRGFCGLAGYMMGALLP